MLVFYLLSWLRRPWRPLRLVANLLTGRQESRGELALQSAGPTAAPGPAPADRSGGAARRASGARAA